MTAAVSPLVVEAGNGTHEIDLDGPVLIVDADDADRSLIAPRLSRAGMRTVEASSGEEALEAARRERPALVLLDVCLSDTNGYEICRTLRSEFGDDLPIIFTSGERVDPLDRTAGLMLGADDYIVKPFDPDELVARVRRFVVRTRRAHFQSSVRYDLTPRELEVLRLLAGGNRPADIARQLFISPKTVSNHMQRLFAKLGVHSQGQAVATAFQENLL
jgi:DNA-binding NarL/FixJ family response regulator